MGTDQQQHGHAGGAQQRGERREPASAQAAAYQCLVEVFQQAPIARLVGLLLAALLNQPHATDTFHQVCGEAAALLGHLGPVAL